MSTVKELSEQERDHLDRYLAFLQPNGPAGTRHAPSPTPAKRDDLPFVTLTYACSLDGQISLAPGVRTTLSGPETKGMTHYLRLRHDAILVGVGTAVADDPSLNCRYPGVEGAQQPQPVIIDPRARWVSDGSAAVRLARNRQCRRPWIIRDTARGDIEASQSSEVDYIDMPAPGASEGQHDWLNILRELKRRGIGSVMIEGGATVLNALLVRADLVDAVIVTIAPTWLGQGGVHVAPASKMAEGGQRQNAARLRDVAWRTFGEDVVLCGRLRPAV